MSESDTKLHNPQAAEETKESDEERAVPRLPDAPQKWRQDTQPVSGEGAMDLPEETDLEQKQPVQG